MTSARHRPNRFGIALKFIRKAKGLPQEAFALHSSRTYVSTLERGLKSPTLNKVDELAEVLGVQPLSLLLLAYLKPQAAKDVTPTLEAIKREVEELLNSVDIRLD